MTKNCRGISLIAFTAAAVTVAASSASALTFSVSAETAPGSNIFNTLGYIDALPAITSFAGGSPTIGSFADFYSLENGQFSGPRDLVRNGNTTIFMLDALDGLGLTTIHGLGTRGAIQGSPGAINISYETSEIALFEVLDGEPTDPNINDFYFVDGNEVTAGVATNVAGFDFRTAQRYTVGQTDGSIIGAFANDKARLKLTGLEILITLEDTIGQELLGDDPQAGGPNALTGENPVNLPLLRIVGNLDPVAAANRQFNISNEIVIPSEAGLRVRLTFVPAPATLVLFGLGLAMAGFAARRSR